MSKVSIIIAVYNVKEYIERCLDSVIKQSLEDIEIIVINDGSTDGVLDILNKYDNEDHRVKIYNKRNSGLIEARKSGLSFANGKYVLFLDGDDWIEETAAEKLYNEAEGKGLDLVYYNLAYAYENTKIANEIYDFKTAKEYEFLELILKNKIRANIVLQFINREFIERNKIAFPNGITYGEDLAITLLIAMNKPLVGCLNEPLYNYYQRSNSITNKVSKKVFDIEKVFELAKFELLNKGIYEKFEKQFLFLMYIHLYYYRVIAVNYLGDIHKKLYSNWKDKDININNNEYIVNFIKKTSTRDRLKIYLYDKNYNLGAYYSSLYNKIVGSLKK